MIWDRVRGAKEKHERRLLKKPNVVGVGVGKKIVKGQVTEEPAVVVFVERKLPEAQLRKRDVIPKVVEDVKTDVVETGKLKALGTVTLQRARTDRWRPAPGGVSLGHYKITAGTLGGLVRRGGETFILSNNHVLANANDARAGDPILQPGPADGGTPADAIARLETFVAIRFDPGSGGGFMGALRRFAERLGIRPAASSPQNFADAALARPLQAALVVDEILGLPRTPGIAEVEAGATVRKSGRTTGVTEGRVLAMDSTVQIDYDGKTATYADQIVAGPISQGGDSGSLVLDAEGRVAGLLFAGSDTTTIVNRARRVVEALGIEF